jgi:hypothetical protein
MNRWRRLKESIIWAIPPALIFLLALYCGICSAGSGDGGNLRNEGGAPSVSGEIVFEGRAEPGSGTKGPDVKGMAVADAEGNALLEAVRPMVHPVLFIRERDFLLKVLMKRKGDILEGAHIVSEGGTESGGHKVLMAAHLRSDVAENVLLPRLATRIIFLTPRGEDGKPSKGNSLGSAVSSLARKRGLKVVDLAGLYDERTKSLISALRSGDREGALPLYLYLLAGAVMEGRVTAAFSEKTGEIYSSRAEGSLCVARAGRDSVTFAVHGVKGFGSNERKANLDAGLKASAALSSKAIKSFSGRQKKK